MKLDEIIRQALDERGLRNQKDASRELGISLELLRLILNKGHVPKDKTLAVIAEGLDLEKTSLIMAAHQEKVPVELKGFFLSPIPGRSYHTKRKWPLSEDQCHYLGKIMSPEEIQIVRKFRQVSAEGQMQVVSYFDYMFGSHRAAPAPHPGERQTGEDLPGLDGE